MLDAFTCERKHRAYKKLCANKTLQPGRGTLAKTALLTLTEHSLNQPLGAEVLDTTLLGNAERNHIMAAAMNVKGPVWLGIGIAHKSCRYVRHRFATLNKTTAFEILCGLSHGKQFFLLVELLTAVDVSTPGHTCWARPSAADTSTALIQVEDDFNQKNDVALYIRHDTGNRLWLLHWLKPIAWRKKRASCMKKTRKPARHSIIWKNDIFLISISKKSPKKHSIYIAYIKPTYFLLILTVKISKIYVRYVRYM